MERAGSGWQSSTLAPALSVQDVRVERNTISETLANGVRIGEGTGVTSTMTGTRPDGSAVTRYFSGGAVGRVSLAGIAMSGTGAKALAIKNQPTASYNVHCEGLSSQGQPLTDAACGGAAPSVTGSSLSCGG